MYKIIGANQMEYGPVSADQLRAWVAEGRVNAQTPVQAEGETTWKPLSMYPELASALPPSAAPPAVPGVIAVAQADGRARAVSLVSGPAVGLIVVGAINICLAVGGILLQLLGMGMAGVNSFQNTQNPGVAQMMAVFNGGMGIVLRVVGIICGIFIIYASIKMKKLENYGLAIAASIVAMLPILSPCCCVGLAIGIWALVILGKADVKQYFS
jgi:hypothetical protein